MMASWAGEHVQHAQHKDHSQHSQHRELSQHSQHSPLGPLGSLGTHAPEVQIVSSGRRLSRTFNPADMPMPIPDGEPPPTLISSHLNSLGSSKGMTGSETCNEAAVYFHRTGSLVPLESMQTMNIMLEQLQDKVRKRSDKCGSNFVITMENPFRTFWSIMIVLLLVYTGTVFLFRIAFLDFRIPREPGASSDKKTENELGWMICDWVASLCFWSDLVINFFMTYEDSAGAEVVSLRAIVRHYLCTHFIIDLIACMPDDVISWAIQTNTPINTTQGVKAFRLQRMTRLCRLMRLTRLMKLTKHMNGPLWAWFQQQRGFHIVNLTCTLAFVVHVMACGWYLCAACHTEPEETWVARRAINAAGTETLIDSPAFVQWAHSMYFTLTVFTTVGFGDMSAMTTGEISYVCFMMLVGAVVHSIVISSVITVVTSSDQVHDFIRTNSKLIGAFAAHTEMSEGAEHEMQAWVSMSAKYWITHQYDKEEMKNLIVGKIMPPHLLARLPFELFGGKFVNNSFFATAALSYDIPARLPLLLALKIQKLGFDCGDVIYQVEEYSFGLFLVLSGTFAFVGRPQIYGGTSAKKRLNHDEVSSPSKRVDRDLLLNFHNPGNEMLSPYRLFGFGSYFGENECFQNCLRMATARCESSAGGTLLMLNKTDLTSTFHEFPQFATNWRIAAGRRERAKVRQLARLTHDVTYEELAVSQISRFWRQYSRAKSKEGCIAPSVGSVRDLKVSANSSQVGSVAMAAIMEGTKSVVPTATGGGGGGGGGGCSSVDCRDAQASIQALTKTQARLTSDVNRLNAKVDTILQILLAQQQQQQQQQPSGTSHATGPQPPAKAEDSTRLLL